MPYIGPGVSNTLMPSILIQIHLMDNKLEKTQHQRAMAKRSPDPVHCWLIWRKAHEAVFDYLYRGIAETGISDTDFRVLEALLHKGPLPVNKGASEPGGEPR